VIFAVGSAGLRVVMLYWNPEADSCWSGIDLSCDFTLRNERRLAENSGIAGGFGRCNRHLQKSGGATQPRDGACED